MISSMIKTAIQTVVLGLALTTLVLAGPIRSRTMGAGEGIRGDAVTTMGAGEGIEGDIISTWWLMIRSHLSWM